MATPSFKKATKEQSFLRLGISGPAGSGKTYTALTIATEMSKLKPGKIAVIDTERGSASKYADIFEFDVLELNDDYHPDRFISAIDAAVNAGYLYVIIDSTTHEWAGKGGCLELHAIETRKTKNSYTAWNAITPLHNRFFDAILGAKAHVIGTVRSKVEYVQEKDDSGRSSVKKLGMGSIQREGADFEYDVTLEMGVDHFGVIGKNRCAAIDGKGWSKPGVELAKSLVDWLSSGAAPTVKEPEPAEDHNPLRDLVINELFVIANRIGMAEDAWIEAEAGFAGLSVERLQAKLKAWTDRAVELDKAKEAEAAA